MEVICHTPSKLAVTYREPTARVIITLICLALIVFGGIVASITTPPFLEFSGLVTAILVVTLLIIIAGAIYVTRCLEVYTFDKEQQSFILEHIGPLHRRSRSGHLLQIKQVYQQSDNDNDSIKEYVILVIAPRDERLRLPMRLYSFSASEREWFGGLLCSFLGMPVRVEWK